MSMSRTTDLKAWRPRHVGLIYCSPACGCGCTRADWNAAKEAAARLAKDLGKDWRPRVWENAGWHYAAEKGSATVYEYFHGKGRRGRDLHLHWNTTPLGQVLVKARTPREMRKKLRARIIGLREAADKLELI